jgi:hypothetical protein
MSCHISVAVQATGRMVISMGDLVSRPPVSLWWSMMARMLALLIEGGSSAGLLVSTITTSWPSSTSSITGGNSTPQRRRTNCASVLGVPRIRASAAPGLWCARYQAQIRGEQVESVSGDLWPKTSVVMEAVR